MIAKTSVTFLRLLLAINRDDFFIMRLLLAMNRDDVDTFFANTLLRIATAGLRRQSGRKKIFPHNCEMLQKNERVSENDFRRAFFFHYISPCIFMLELPRLFGEHVSMNVVLRVQICRYSDARLLV